jgi:hypothetical protein
VGASLAQQADIVAANRQALADAMGRILIRKLVDRPVAPADVIGIDTDLNFDGFARRSSMSRPIRVMASIAACSCSCWSATNIARCLPPSPAHAPHRPARGLGRSRRAADQLHPGNPPGRRALLSYDPGQFRVSPDAAFMRSANLKFYPRWWGPRQPEAGETISFSSRFGRYSRLN